MRLYWWQKEGRGNFGDELGPYFLRRVGRKVSWAPLELAQIVSVGSLVEMIPNGWRGLVVGTGTMTPDGPKGTLWRARVLAVRGALTRNYCGLRASTPLGDPGILIGRRPHVEPTRDAALVPHYVDRQMVERHPGLPVIDICDPVESVIAAIADCRLIFTSSLHALVAADALGVPHVFEPHPAVAGGLWKFRDYASAFDEDIVPGKERLTDRHAMRERTTAMAAIWHSL